MQTAAAATITHREFKLLLKPERFPVRKALLAFNDFLHENATKLGVKYEQFDAIDSQTRVVQFYDTPDQTLRKNKLILRIRQLREGGWPDDSWEVTFKCRAEDLEQAQKFDSSSIYPQQKKKFKEELLHGDEPASIVSIYSNNCILESPEVDLTLPVGKLAHAFPHVKSLGLDETQTLSIVDDAKIFEIEAKLGNLFFGHHTTATATLAVWARPIVDRFEPLVAEFGWSYHPVDDDKGREADANADRFFKAIQVPLRDWLAAGTTKTALIYRDNGA
jgi:hypothetical protein